MIEVQHLSKAYGRHRALSDVSFTAPAGLVTGFVGPNGAGKSTVMRIVAGLTAPDEGVVRVDGAPFADAPAPASTMGVFLSAEWIPAAATAAAVLEYACDTQGFSRVRAHEALELVGLTTASRNRVGSFSLGMRQRLGIAIATLGHPRILLLDEPVNGLDPDGIHWFRSFLQGAAADGATVLLSSHHMSELAMIADRVVMLDAGRVVADGALDDLVTAQTSEVFVMAGDRDALRRELISAGYRVDLADGGLLVRDADPLGVGKIAFATGVGLTHLELASRSLEETYFDTVSNTGRKERP